MSLLSQQVHIRQITRADLPALEWEGKFTHFRRLFAEAYRQSEKGDAVMWVADLPGVGIIGQVFVQLTSPRNELADGHMRAYVYAFRVRAEYRGAGVGTRLMQAAEADLIQRGFTYVSLNVGRDNPAARRLYERLGYRVVAAEQGDWSYIDDRGHLQHVHEPAWRMEKMIFDF